MLFSSEYGFNILNQFSRDPVRAERLPDELKSDENILRIHKLVDQLIQRLTQSEGKHLKVKIRREIAPTVLIALCVLNKLASDVDDEKYGGENEAIGHFQTGCTIRHDRWMLESSVNMLFDGFAGDVLSNGNDLVADPIPLQRLRLRVFLGKCPVKMDYAFNLNPKHETKIIQAREEWEIARQYVQIYVESMPEMLEDVSMEDIERHISDIDKSISRYILMRED